MSNKKYSASEKFIILSEIKSGETGVSAAVKKYGIPKTTLAKWRPKY
ncbi:helix-turn-helix domain-containing protein [Paenibacillus sp. IHBB 10380]|nr:helix-turn-helix domain-containing protein [Paenibacillus sp. IHBB 10380]